ncbi:MAG: aminodeoxychorismate/anthranilate synthase component II [Cyclobacteriaceae bacterium]
MKRVIVIDNYDSFTYNLVHILKEMGLGNEMDVFRNDKISVDEVGDYRNILLSPGPGVPKDAGIMPEVIKKYASAKNILGVCLGHQGIGEGFGAKLFNLPIVYHGVTTDIAITAKDELFEGIPDTFKVCRYHSWAIDSHELPKSIQVTAKDPDGRIMAIKHESYNVRGVQFHPESIMTEHGKKMIENWIALEN